MTTARSLATCPFCKIIKGEKPSFKVAETRMSYAFTPIPPLTDDHTLIVPKHHAAKMHELPDEYLADALVVAKGIALEKGFKDYNILQNNGRVAYQTVDHVHFHIIPKPDANTGLVVRWPSTKSAEEMDEYRAKVFAKHGATGKSTCRYIHDR